MRYIAQKGPVSRRSMKFFLAFEPEEAEIQVAIDSLLAKGYIESSGTTCKFGTPEWVLAGTVAKNAEEAARRAAQPSLWKRLFG